MKKKSCIALAVLTLIIAVAGGLWGYRRSSQPQIEHVVIISIDTCRADHLSCYGFDKDTTPNIDAVAAEGVLFEKVVSPNPFTLPAHSSMLTGTNPLYHGVHLNKQYSLTPSNLTLAEILKENGFATGGIISSFVLDSQFGLDQGFDLFNDNFDDEKTSGGFIHRTGGESTKHALDWISEHARERSFLFLHYYDPHFNYDPPEPFSTNFKDDLYAGEIAYTDHCIGQVIDKLKELDIYDTTLLIITGDHGEALGEHGEDTHGYFIYDCSMRVPLVIRAPGLPKGKRISEMVGIIDIVPTVCSMLGLEMPPVIHGKDLSGYFKRRYRAEERLFYGESLQPTMYDLNSLVSVQNGSFKYIQTTRPELYDLNADPGELNNIIANDPKRARLLKENLKLILEEQVRHDTGDSQLALDEESKKKLASLGYVDTGSVDQSFDFDQTKSDPKDFIDLHVIMALVVGFVSNDEFDEAKELCLSTLEKHPDFIRLYKYLGIIAMKEGDVEKGFEYYDKLLKARPDSSDLGDIYEKIGMGYYQNDRYEEAIDYLRKSLAIQPNSTTVLKDIADTYFVLKRFDEALEYYRKRLELEPDSIVYKLMGEIFIAKDQTEEAIYHLNESLKLDPKQAGVHNALAELSVGQNKIDEALAHYSLSVEIQPDQYIVHNTIGLILTKQGKLNEAIIAYKKALEVDPELSGAHNNAAMAYLQLNKIDSAQMHLAEAVRLDPNSVNLLNKLAEVKYRQGKIKEALANWDKAIKIKPDLPDILNNMAWIMTTSNDPDIRNVDRALGLAKHANTIAEGKRPSFLDTLAVAYASKGDFDNALETAQKAAEMYKSSDNEKMSAEIEKRIQLYRSQKPYIE